MPVLNTEWNLHTIRSALAELERFGNWFMARKCDIPDVKVVVNVQTRGRRIKLCGMYTPDQWSTREGEKVHEIMIAAEHLKDDVYSILGTMAHECVHYWMNHLDIKGTAKSGRHNKNFKEYAETAELTVDDPTDRLGYAYTTITDDLRHAIEHDFQPDLTAFDLFRAIAPPKTTRENPNKKWSCNCTPPVNIRAAVHVDAICQECSEYFEVQV